MGGHPKEKEREQCHSLFPGNSPKHLEQNESRWMNTKRSAGEEQVGHRYYCWKPWPLAKWDNQETSLSQQLLPCFLSQNWPECDQAHAEHLLRATKWWVLQLSMNNGEYSSWSWQHRLRSMVQLPPYPLVSSWSASGREDALEWPEGNQSEVGQSYFYYHCWREPRLLIVSRQRELG